MAPVYAWLVGEKTVKNIPAEAKEKLSVITGIVVYQPKTVTYEIGEWRGQFSAIHQWIIKNGIPLADKEILVYKSHLQELRKDILTVLEDYSLAPKYLPVVTPWLSYVYLAQAEKYEETYFETLRKTRDILTPLDSDFNHFVYTWND